MRASGVHFLAGLAALTVACDDAATPATPTSDSSASSAAATGGAGGGGPSAEVRFFTNPSPEVEGSQEVESTSVRWGDPVRVVVENLAPGRRVKLDFSSLGSFGEFTADMKGTIDTGRDAPSNGSWASADLDGPFWSAAPVAKPVFDVTLDVTDATSGEPLATGALHRRPVNDGVDVTEVHDGTRVGFLTRPQDGGSAKRPAILVFGGSEGGTSTGRFFAYYLAQLGYVAFGVGYFGADGLPAELDSVPLEILKSDLDLLASQPDVDATKIAVMGGSRGGELALLLGAHYPELVRAVVAQIPSGYVWGSVANVDAPAWTLGGAPLPQVPYSGALPVEYTENGKTYYNGRNVFLEDIAAATPAELEAARIPIESAMGPVLLLGGEDDQLWPSCVLADVAYDKLVASGHAAKFADENHCYPGAGHFISFPPGSSTLGSDSYYSADFHLYFVVGGTPEANAKAERAGNTVTRAFLTKAFSR
ncbi:MAG: acyl-CoA thioesterase/bile acid-CoA:amino acid N-acyltransferase family protein [Polyangiaceae bacterium]